MSVLILEIAAIEVEISDRGKADKISRGQYQKHFSIIRKKLQLEKDEKIIPISSLKKTGVEEVWNEIISQYREHGYDITVD